MTIKLNSLITIKEFTPIWSQIDNTLSEIQLKLNIKS
jgi:hypothetical protein